MPMTPRAGKAGFDGFDDALSAWLRGLLWRLAKRVAVVAVLLLAALWLLSVARAQQGLCMPGAALAEHLRGQFGEIAAFDFTLQDKAAKFYANPMTQTWTVTVEVEGRECVAMGGSGFKPPTKPKAPTL